MDITVVLKALLIFILVLVAKVLVPYIKSKTTAEQQDEIKSWVRIAVEAAEQLYKGSGRGAEKKAYVIDWLAKQGFTVDTAEIDALIESAVYKLKGGDFGEL